MPEENRDKFNERFSESARAAIEFNDATSSKQFLNPENVITPVKVAIRLKAAQYRGLNKWECTLRGEKREVTIRDVVFYCYEIEDAIHSYNKNEIDKITITGEFH